MRICGFLESCLVRQSIDDNKNLPTSWNDFEVISYIKKDLKNHSLFELKTINSFAIVPGAPLIQPESGISGEYRGHRLFLISREENITKYSGKGRCVILIKPEELDSKPVRTYSYFIPEETALLILKQIKGFDPKEQPIAFENIDQLEREKKASQEKMEQTIRENMRTNGKFKPDNRTTPGDQPSINWESYKSAWITGGVILTAFFIWIFVRKRVKN